MSLASEHDNWWGRGACLSAEPDLFFPLSSAAGCQSQIASAKAICARCQVRRQCLSFALTSVEVHGIWGGLTEEERQELRRRRARGLDRGPGRPRAEAARAS